MSTLAVGVIQTLVPGVDTLDIQAAGITFNGGPLPGGGGPGGGNVAIYDPDIGATTGNRYKTWAEVMTQVGTWNGVGGEVWIKKVGIFQTATVPAGTYDLSNVYLRTTSDTLLPILSFADGTTLTGFPRALEALVLQGNNTSAPMFTVPAFAICVLRDASIRNGPTTTQPVISVPVGTNFTFSFDTALSPLYTVSGGSESVFVEGTVSIDIWKLADSSFFSVSNVFTDYNSGLGNVIINSYVLVPGGYTPSHATFTGTFTYNPKAETRVNELLPVPKVGYQRVEVVSISDVPIATTNDGAVIDGVTLASTRILLVGQAAPAENGIYVSQTSGGLLRASDYDTDSEIRGSLVSVANGTSFSGRLYYNSNTTAINVNFTAMTFDLVLIPTAPTPNSITLSSLSNANTPTVVASFVERNPTSASQWTQFVINVTTASGVVSGQLSLAYRNSNFGAPQQCMAIGVADLSFATAAVRGVGTGANCEFSFTSVGTGFYAIWLNIKYFPG